jgi:hypothetical protein
MQAKIGQLRSEQQEAAAAPALLTMTPLPGLPGAPATAKLQEACWSILASAGQGLEEGRAAAAAAAAAGPAAFDPVLAKEQPFSPRPALKDGPAPAMAEGHGKAQLGQAKKAHALPGQPPAPAAAPSRPQGRPPGLMRLCGCFGDQ